MFETLLVRDGRPLELEAHLARLDDSLRTLFGAPAPSTAPTRVLEHARGEELARLRLTVAPDPDGTLVADVVVAPVDASLVFPSWDRGVELAPVVVVAGIGAHKWADRRLLAGLEADVAPALPLLLDGDGTALEASRGNLFVVHGETLVTPPADGRILPGITRGRVVQLADALDIPVREEAIAFDSISTATEVFLTGAVRGIEPVRACGGAIVESGERITAALSRDLDLLWQGGAAHARVD
ncbi:MAG: para-aminobenzoate synthetase / 4-amino-4-deoxychorismate lyase [Solirubrobacteraceae bacterium]